MIPEFAHQHVCDALHRAIIERDMAREEVARLKIELASRPPALAWTSEPPRVPGRYLNRPGKKGKNLLLVRMLVADYWDKDGCWLGPIPEPPA